MKLIEQLRSAKGFTAGLILSFDVTLDWFERLLGGQLALQGIRRLAVLADGECLSGSIETQVALLRGAGRQYVVHGITMPRGRFHPKAVLLSGPSAARLYIGSGNLSASGFGRNVEIFERWDVASTADTVPRAFDSIRRYVDQILDGHSGSTRPSELQEVLDKVFGADVLAGKASDQSGPEVLGSPAALFDRLPSPPTGATTLTLVAPYFDDGGHLVGAVADHFRAATFEVVTDPRRSNLSRRATQRIRDRGGTIVALDDERSLHAKVLYAAGPGWEVSITGSANLSQAAWRGFNAELVTLRQDDDATAVGRLLDQIERREISDIEWDALWTRVEEDAAKAASVENQPSGAHALSARWVDRNLVHVSVRDAFSTELAAEWCEGGNTYGAKARPLAATAGLVEVVRPLEVERGAHVVAIRLVDGTLRGRWIFVHDPAELREASRAPSRSEQKLDELLAAGEDDLEAAQRLVAFLAEIWRERRDAEEVLGSERTEDDQEGTPAERNRLVRLADKDFVEPRPVPQGPTKAAPAATPISLPVRLMERLLFGADADADAEEGESDETDEQDEAEPERARISGRRADPGRSVRFLHAATAARDAYLDQLRAHDDDVPPLRRLLEDLQVLMAPIHYGVRAGAVLPGDFAAQIAPVLRAFLGRRTAALPTALASLSAEEAHGVWSRGELLLLLALFFYNLWLAAYTTTREDDESIQPTMFGLSLWMRHLVRHAPKDELDRVLSELPRRLPRLRVGVLWIAHRWPDAANTLPFMVFLQRLFSDVHAFLVVENAIGSQLHDLTTRSGVRDLIDEDSLVLGTGRDGCLAPGFVDVDDGSRHRRSATAYLRDGAFLDARPHDRRSAVDPMYKVSTKALVPIDVIDTLLNDSRPELQSALEVLKRVAEE